MEITTSVYEPCNLPIGWTFIMVILFDFMWYSLRILLIKLELWKDYQRVMISFILPATSQWVLRQVNEYNLSSVLRRECTRETLLFYFDLKKSAAEWYQMLAEAMATVLHRKKTCRYWFNRFKEGNFTTTSATRIANIGLRRLRVIKCRFFWTRAILNGKKCLPSNCVLLNQPFPSLHAPKCDEKDSKDQQIDTA